MQKTENQGIFLYHLIKSPRTDSRSATKEDQAAVSAKNLRGNVLATTEEMGK